MKAISEWSLPTANANAFASVSSSITHDCLAKQNGWALSSKSPYLKSTLAPFFFRHSLHYHRVWRVLPSLFICGLDLYVRKAQHIGWYTCLSSASKRYPSIFPQWKHSKTLSSFDFVDLDGIFENTFWSRFGVLGSWGSGVDFFSSSTASAFKIHFLCSGAYSCFSSRFSFTF